MAEIPLSDAERKVLSYVARGVNKDKAVDKISQFFGMQPTDVMGLLSNLKRQGLIIESNNIAATVTVLTISPIKVKRSMLDANIMNNLAEREQGTRAGALKRQIYTQDMRTGEIRDNSAPLRNTNAPTKKSGANLGFELE